MKIGSLSVNKCNAHLKGPTERQHRMLPCHHRNCIFLAWNIAAVVLEWMRAKVHLSNRLMTLL